MFEFRQKEKRILLSIDRLVQLLIEASGQQGPAKESLLAAGIALIQDMRPLLLELLDAREEHLESLLRQLIMQKLPQRHILASFSGFQKDLNHVLQLALSDPQAEAEATPLSSAAVQVQAPVEASVEAPVEAPLFAGAVPAPTAAKKEPPDVEALLLHHYQGYTLLKNHAYGSIRFAYYWPQLALALIESAHGLPLSRSQQIRLQQDGIRWIELKDGDLGNPRHLLRKLQKPC